jgi:hypothetical protein
MVPLAEGAERIVAEDLAKAVGDQHVVRRQHAAGEQIGQGRLVLPGHVLEGVKAIVVEEVHLSQSGKQ